jgi:demethylmenaquinone methyltransferase/2-methoxy-6-polyprenyl-1,4-benzoquinol methylase
VQEGHHQVQGAGSRFQTGAKKRELTTMSDDTTRHFYDRLSGAYDLLADSSEHASRDKGVELLAPRAGERILEIGFGTGHVLLQLAEQVGPQGRVDGVDISPGMQEVAQKRVEEAGMQDRVSLQVANTPPLPYDDDQFDAVFMSFTLELFPLTVIPQLLLEIGRVLKEGGRFANVSMAVVDPKLEHESVLERTYVWMHRHFPHIVDCQPINAGPLLMDAGFDISAEQRLDIWTMPVEAVVGVYHASKFADAAARLTARESSVQEQIEHFASSSPNERIRARQRICAMGHVAVAPLLKALGSPNHQVQWESAKCLTKVSRPSDAKQLAAELGHEDNDVRWLVADALIHLGEPGLVAVLELLASGEGGHSFELYQGARHVLRQMAVHGKSQILHGVLEALSHQSQRIGVPGEAEKALVIIQPPTG